MQAARTPFFRSLVPLLGLDEATQARLLDRPTAALLGSPKV
jgi:hypothetical protein